MSDSTPEPLPILLRLLRPRFRLTKLLLHLLLFLLHDLQQLSGFFFREVAGFLRIGGLVASGLLFLPGLALLGLLRRFLLFLLLVFLGLISSTLNGI